jgi:hypothetical protein
MNLFDDLIPQQGSGPQGSAGLFDDLVPQTPAPAARDPRLPGPFTRERLNILREEGISPEREAQQQAIDDAALLTMFEDEPQPRAFEGVMGPGTAAAQYDNPFGSAGVEGPNRLEPAIEAITGRNERAQIGEVAPSVQMGGAPLSQRLNFGFMQTPEAEREFFERRFGPENEGWYFLNDPFGAPTSRVVTRNPDGTEQLFNPPGLDFGDIAGAAGVLPDIAGGMGGAVAAMPSFAFGPTAGIAGTSAGGALGAATASGLVGRAFPENRAAESAGQAASRKGVDALVDFGLGNVMGQSARGLSGLFGRVAAPFAESASRGLAPAFRESSGRLRDQGYDVMPLPSQEGAGGFMPRVEGFLEKLPGSSAFMENRRAQGDDAVARYTQELIGGATPGESGRRVASELEAGRDALVRERDTLLSQADETIQSGFEGAAARQGPAASAEEAGQQMRGGLERARGEFRSEADRLYTAARQAPGGTDSIVPTSGLRDRVAQIRSELPPEATRELQRDTGLLDASGRPVRRTETTGGGPSPEFTPDGLRRFFSGVDDIAENLTIDQARQMRRLLSDAIDDKTVLPGVPDRFLAQMRDELTEAIEGAAQRASPELRNALTEANTFYRENRPRFDRSGVRETFRGADQAGFREDNRLVERFLTGRGNPGLIRETRDLMGADSAEWATVRRNAWDQIVDKGRSKTLHGREVVDADALVARLNSMDDETVRELFNVDAGQLRALAADLSNRTRYLDVDALSDAGTPTVTAALRRAAEVDEQIAREYRESVVAPFLRGENGARARIDPEELVPYLYRTARPSEVQQIMARLTPEMRNEVERGTVADVLSRGMSRGDDVDGVLRLLSGEATPPNAGSVIDSLGAASGEQRERISAILSPETRQSLTDLAVIAASSARQDTVTAAAGGIAAGTAITRMASDPASAAVTAAVFRGFAEIVTSDWFRRWTTRTSRPGLSEDALGQAAGSAPQTLPALGELVSEYGSADARAALDFLMQGSQIGPDGERLNRPPAGFETWADFFSGGQDDPALEDLIME